MGVLARKAGDIATRSRERSYDTGADGVACCREDDRDCGCRLLCCERGQRVVGDDYIDLESHELICNLDKTLAASVRPTILDRDIAPLRPTYLPQPGDKCRSPLTLRRRRARAQQPDGRQFARLLRVRRERPRHRRAAEQRDEFAPFHCPMPPVLPTERIAHLAGACCAAGFQSRLCRLWVIFVRPTRFRRSRHVRIAPKADK